MKMAEYAIEDEHGVDSIIMHMSIAATATGILSVAFLCIRWGEVFHIFRDIIVFVCSHLWSLASLCWGGGDKDGRWQSKMNRLASSRHRFMLKFVSSGSVGCVCDHPRSRRNALFDIRVLVDCNQCYQSELNRLKNLMRRLTMRSHHTYLDGAAGAARGLRAASKGFRWFNWLRLHLREFTAYEADLAGNYQWQYTTAPNAKLKIVLERPEGGRLSVTFRINDECDIHNILRSFLHKYQLSVHTAIGSSTHTLYRKLLRGL
eukprot:GHVQ01019615.1.p1 GENE.GHVQ01019615.1~~GHVQ01019615.1.p1  ORF type:complete len:261 (+),score=18.39 GHVQ01019615.1:144-926(+)